MSGLDPSWLAALRASGQLAPARPRLPLLAGDVVIGSVEPEFLNEIRLQPMSDGRVQLSKTEHAGAPAWRLQGEPTAALGALALALREAGLAHAWRDEQLAVTDGQGRRVGSVERAVVRVLGITTAAVHLVGRAEDGRFWVQQRAWSKSNDPGMWDTLMGGMISSADTLASALERETWEEAGLRLEHLQGIVRGGHVDIRRPCDDGHGAGYVIERIDWFHCSLPDGVLPVNQDGEVERFVLMDVDEMTAKMHAGEFTSEAALIQAALLEAGANPSD
ncbi:MAG: NUDIX hydrolase [Polaromonas sp.]|uniref:NUDIX hydrolase n=1 Tax=Polaromonas sp. TaxID=1869339 RepID=UPI004035705F